MTIPRIAVVTPAKNEMKNLPQLVASMESQVLPVFLWVCIDDSSSDGTGNYLEQQCKTIRNVRNMLAFHPQFPEQDYALGPKYATVVAFGFEKVNEFQVANGIMMDYIGICDADCFLEPEYYLKLVERFEVLPKLGIGSGVIYYRDKTTVEYDKMPLRWARGAVRLWRSDCFREAGYKIAYSADGISSALAWTRGWEAQAFKDIRAESRKMGDRVDQNYYGLTAYYRYNPGYYIFLKFILMIFRSGLADARIYYKGYLDARKKKHRIPLDKRTIFYFKMLIIRIIIENIVVIKNYIILKLKTRKRKQ